MPFNHLKLCHPLLQPSLFPNIRVFSLCHCWRWGPEVCKCAKLGYCSSDFLSLWQAQAFPWTCSAVSYWPPQSIFMASNQSPLSGVQPLKPEPQHPTPTHRGRCANSVLARKCWFAMISMVNFPLCFPSTCCWFPSEILYLHLSLPLREFPSVQKVFLLHSSLPKTQVPVPNPLSIYFFISFALHHYLEISLLFGSLGSSASVQVFYRGWSYADAFLMYLWAGRWYAYLTLLPPCVGLPNRL